MITFTRFKEIVRAEGGIWASASVRFSKTQAEFAARYQPHYPETSIEDEEVHLLAPGGLWSHQAERIRQAAEQAEPGQVLAAIAAAKTKCHGFSIA